MFPKNSSRKNSCKAPGEDREGSFNSSQLAIKTGKAQNSRTAPLTFHNLGHFYVLWNFPVSDLCVSFLNGVNRSQAPRL